MAHLFLGLDPLKTSMRQLILILRLVMFTGYRDVSRIAYLKKNGKDPALLVASRITAKF